MKKVVNYIRSSFEEMIYKVTWPTWDQLQKYTVLVLTGILIMTVIIYVMDFLSKFVFEGFYNIFG